MTDEKKKLIIVICFAITILIAVIGVISSMDFGEELIPKPTPVVTTKPVVTTGTCLHTVHTPEDIPKCTKCNAITKHTYASAIYEVVSNTLTHKVKTPPFHGSNGSSHTPPEDLKARFQGEGRGYIHL